MRVLFVDDEISLLDQAKDYLERQKDELEVYTANSAEEALEHLETDTYDAVVSDYMMPEIDGIEFLRTLREEKGDSIPFIIFTGRGREDVAMEALNLGADRYVMKDGNPESKYALLADAIVQAVKHRENAEMLVELNSLLISIRNINRLIYQEDEVSSLIEKSCDVLLDTGGYLNVEIALIDEDGKIKPFSSSGEHDHWDWELKKDGEGDAPECVKEAMRSKSTLTIKGMKDYCRICAYPEDEIDHHTVLVPMVSEEEVFGFLIVCHKQDRFISRREVELLEEVADDLTLARRRIMAENILNEERDLFVEGSTILFKWSPKDGWPIKYVTPNVENLLGYSQESMMNGEITYADILPEHDLHQVKREVDRHLDIGSERINHRPYQVRKKDGGTVWVKDHTKIIKDGGEVKYYMGYLVDITEQKQTEEALQKSEERYRRLFESAKDGILILNSKTGEIKDANPYIIEILGYSLDEMQEKKLWEVGSFEQIVDNRERFNELKENGYVRYEDIPLETKDGEEVPVEFVSNVYNAGGEEVIQCNIREISGRKEVEEKLEEKHRLLQSLLSNAPGMAFRCLNDENYTMKFISEGCKELTEYHPDSLIDNDEISYIDLILPEDRDKVRKAIDQASKEDDRYEVTYRIQTAEGDIKWVSERGKAVQNGKNEGYIEGMIMDITERKEANERKSFLQTMLRHDVGNKTQTAKGYLKLLKDEYEDEELIDKTMEVINEAQEIIEKVEHLRRIEEQDEMNDIYITHIIKSVLSKYETHLDHIDIDLQVDDENLEVLAGPLLDTLFSNLIENSIRHSGCDLIRIKVQTQNGEVLVVFEDDGIGIPDEKKEKISERGFKAGESGGSGLGMYLVKKIIEGYEGDLKIKDSKLGGARFDIYLNKA